MPASINTLCIFMLTIQAKAWDKDIPVVVMDTATSAISTSDSLVKYTYIHVHICATNTHIMSY